jgi:hypothetical protein
MTEQMGPSESSLTGTDTLNPVIVQRAREFDAARAAHEAGQVDKITVNGKPHVDGQPIPEAAPTTAPAPAAPVETVKPLEMPISDRPWLTAEQVVERWKADAVGNVAVEHWNRDGSDIKADLPFGIAVQAGVLEGLDDDDLAAFAGILDELGAGFQARLLKAAAKFGRQLAPKSGDAGSLAMKPQSKGPQMAEFNFSFKSRTEGEALFRELGTKKMTAYMNGNTSEAKRLDAEQSALGKVLYPGMNAPEGVL